MSKKKKKKRQKKEPLSNAEKIAIAALIFEVIKWLVELVK